MGGHARAGPLRDGDAQQGLAPLAELGALDDVAQAVKVDVRAADHGDEALARAVQVVLGDVLFQARHRERAGGLGRRARLCARAVTTNTS